MKINVSQDRRENPPLRRAAVRAVVSPVLPITRLQEGSYEVDEPLIIDFLFQHLSHEVMIDVVKEPFDIHLYQPFHRSPAFDLLERRVAGSVGAEPMRPVGKDWLIDL